VVLDMARVGRGSRHIKRCIIVIFEGTWLLLCNQLDVRFISSPSSSVFISFCRLLQCLMGLSTKHVAVISPKTGVTSLFKAGMKSGTPKGIGISVGKDDSRD